jgi:hypothetical protein
VLTEIKELAPQIMMNKRRVLSFGILDEDTSPFNKCIYVRYTQLHWTLRRVDRTYPDPDPYLRDISTARMIKFN